jgi:hypothetical protein
MRPSDIEFSAHPILDEGLIRTVLQILEDNPYIRAFRSLGDVSNLDEYKIELNTDIGVHQRRYNAPTVLQVAAIWEEGTDAKKKFQMSIMVCGISGQEKYIQAYHDVMILFHIHYFFREVRSVGTRKYYMPIGAKLRKTLQVP